MKTILTIAAEGLVRASDMHVGYSLAEAATEWERCVRDGEEVEWFFTSDREGDPILVSYQDWNYPSPAWEILYNEE